MNSPGLEIEKLLMTKLKGGDVNSFKQLYYHYQSKLYHFVFRYLKKKEDSEEIVEECLIHIWEDRSNLNENLSFQSYLFTIAKNKIIDYFRKKKVETLYKNYIQNFIEIVQDSSNKSLIYKDFSLELNGAIGQLPEKRRVIFIMNKKLGMSRAEIAEFFNISENTVKNQLQEAMKFLRETLNKETFLFLIILIKILSFLQ
jgi:RNA polymerase sigma-70 factor, ECF subfamily